ncbi:hypothetical protein ES708_12450 [subsurface metagenome]
MYLWWGKFKRVGGKFSVVYFGSCQNWVRFEVKRKREKGKKSEGVDAPSFLC